MIDRVSEAYGDPLTAPFWEAARRHVLVLQRCETCGHRQFYPRPFCLMCQSLELSWVEASGTGTIYSLVTVRLSVLPGLEPPYQLALIDLREGVRMLSHVLDHDAKIGQSVALAWRERADAPPLPVFRLPTTVVS